MFGDFLSRAASFKCATSAVEISVPATNSIVNRNTTDYTLNFGLNPTVNLGAQCRRLSAAASRRPSGATPCRQSRLNQNLFRMFIYMNTSSFFNAISATGYLIRESGPFTRDNEHSRATYGCARFSRRRSVGKDSSPHRLGSQRSAVHTRELSKTTTRRRISVWSVASPSAF